MSVDLRVNAQATLAEYREGLKGMIPIPAGHYLISGMGASAIPGEVLRDLWGAGPPLVTVSRTALPPRISRNGLVHIVASFSGETKETLAAQRIGAERAYTQVAIGKGGTLGDLAAEGGFTHLPIPGADDDRPARAAFGAFLGRLLALTDFPAREVSADPYPAAEVAAGKLAPELGSGTTMVVAPPGYWALARRFSANLNENAKLLSFWGDLPEFSHNQLQGWAGAAGADARLLFLRHPDEGEEMAERIEVIVELLQAKDVTCLQALLQGENAVARTLYGAILADLVSIQLAEEQGIEPAPTLIQAELKRRLAG